MTFPNTVDTVTLSVGPVLDAGGTPRRGVPLRVTLGTRVRITSSGSVLSSTTTAHTDADGEASVVLVATDSAGVDVTGWTYRVTCPGTIAAGGIDIALPAAVPTVRVEDLTGVTAADGTEIHLPGDSQWVAVVESADYPGLYAIAAGAQLTESPTYPGLYSIGA